MAGGGAVLGLTWWRKPWLRWGVTREEAHLALPGDDLIPSPRLVGTRGITIPAPPTQVWPWLVQMGYGRAGWYAIDAVDNGGEPSAQTIVADLQDLDVGDVLRDATGPFGYRVVVADPARALVLRTTIHPVTGRHVDRRRQPHATFLDLTWAFALTPLDGDRTRLLVRVRYDHTPRWWVRVMVNGFEIADAVSARRMLPNIRDRVEAARPTTPATTAPPPAVQPAAGRASS